MSAEDALREMLRDRATTNGDRDDLARVRFRRESTARILDAAIGVLAATRHLVAVTEEVLSEQRDRMRDEAAAPPRRASDHDRPWRKKIDLDY
jgi:hypothetical protein